MDKIQLAIKAWEKEQRGIYTPAGKVLSEALSQLKALPEQGWRPIESAPRDGSLIISLWGEIPVIAFHSEKDLWQVAMLARDGVYVTHGNYAPWVAKLWQPLPAPPSDKVTL